MMEKIYLKIGIAALLVASVTAVETTCTQQNVLELSIDVGQTEDLREELVQSIYSHPFYAGSMNQFLPGQRNKIYEFLDSEGNTHFYLQNAYGVRHFCIISAEVEGSVTCVLQNGDTKRYFSLPQFLDTQWNSCV